MADTKTHTNRVSASAVVLCSIQLEMRHLASVSDIMF